MSSSSLLIYLLRRDLRVEDSPIFHKLATQNDNNITYLLPIYVFSAEQIEVSGFIPKDVSERSPYPEARSQVGGFWRCGPHRAKFLGESVWAVKEHLEALGSGLAVRVGTVEDVVSELLNEISKKDQDLKVSGVWMTAEEGVEEKREEKSVKQACEDAGVDFKSFVDEKYFIDDRDLPFKSPEELPDVFTSYRKMVEPLRDGPRTVLPTPAKSALPPFPPPSSIPQQHSPFKIPTTYEALESALLSPLDDSPLLSNPPPFPEGARSAHDFHGGAKTGKARLEHLITSGAMTSYKGTRNGLLGLDFSTKLSSWLALGSITARQVHAALLDFEDARNESGKDAEGYGKGENEGTKAVRFELLWRDYMRLCTRKFGHKLFRLSGFREDSSYPWKSPSTSDEAKTLLRRVLEGTTGMGLIDASQRELYLTGYTSNRARQNVASFMSKHLGLDWRLGAEWYESLLVDYDVSSNWGNWQYVAGVGNDPRGEARVFNPVKQSWDYDAKGEYVRTWIPELKSKSKSKGEEESTQSIKDENAGEKTKGEELEISECFQPWTIPEDKRQRLGLKGIEWIEHPLKRIEFTVGRKQGGNNHNHGHGHGHGRGSSGGSSGRSGGGHRDRDRGGYHHGEGPQHQHSQHQYQQYQPQQPSQGRGGYGYNYNYGYGYGGGPSGRPGSSGRGGMGYRGRGYHHHSGRGRGWSSAGGSGGSYGGGRHARTGPAEKDAAAAAEAGTVQQIEVENGAAGEVHG